MKHKPTLLVDFDGVIHRYSKGWHDGTTYDDPMPGAKEYLERLMYVGYEVVIFSTRSSGQIYYWLRQHGFPRLEVTNVKKPAVAIIDDRAIRFDFWQQAFDELIERYPIKRPPCSNCDGPARLTIGLVCPECGRDYS